MKKALLVIDMQNDYFVGGKFPLWNSDECLLNVIEMIRKAKREGIEVILVKHNRKVGLLFLVKAAAEQIYMRL